MGSEAVVGGDERDERPDDGSGDDPAGAGADEPDVPRRSGPDATGWILFFFGGVQFLSLGCLLVGILIRRWICGGVGVRFGELEQKINETLN